MGRYTGNGNTNGFAEPELWRFHTIWPFDNHEVVHVYSAMIGRPTDFFNEGLAVSFQTDPSRDDFAVRFNGVQVHDACRTYLASGVLPLPLSSYVTTAAFRAITDSVVSYRMAGSFVLFLADRFGMAAVEAFMRGATRDDYRLGRADAHERGLRRHPRTGGGAMAGPAAAAAKLTSQTYTAPDRLFGTWKISGRSPQFPMASKLLRCKPCGCASQHRPVSDRPPWCGSSESAASRPS